MKSSDVSLKVFITGACGNLARQLIALLRRQGLRGRSCQFLLTDVQDGAPVERDASTVFRALDLAEPAALRTLVEEFRPEVVLHFGSLLSGASEQNLERAWQINSTASLILLEAAAKLPGCTFFFPSTGATYGGGGPDPLPEDHPQWPLNFYGVAKVAIERMGVYFHQKYKLDFRCLRFPMVLSRYAPPTAVSAYASHAMVQARSGQTFVFPVSPDTGISTIYITDVIEGIGRFVEARSEQLSRRVYNLHAFGPTAQDFAAAIRKLVPEFTCEFKPDPFVDSLLRGWALTIVDASARRDWGWAPRFDLDASVVDMISRDAP